MATGDITSPTIVTETNGMPYLSLTFLGLATTGTFAFGMGTNNDPAAAKVVLTVTSPAYDATGASTTTIRTVYGTRVMRKAYPNEADNDVTVSGSDAVAKVALSDFIYSGETVTIAVGAGLYTATTPTNALAAGTAVTNNSVNAHAKPIGRWETAPYQRINGAFNLDAVGFHRSAKDGKPLACVKFVLTDEHSHSITYTVTDTTLATAGASGIRVPVYRPSGLTSQALVDAGFTDGDTITANVEFYPWVGDSARKSDLIANGGDGYADPERLGPITFLLDNAGSVLPPLYAVVDSATGSGSGVASTTLATAEATRCDTIATAKTKLAAVRANGENCVIYLVDNGGTGYAFNGSSNAWSQVTPARVWTTIAPHPTLGTLAGCPISSGNNTVANGKFRLSGLTLSGTSAGTFRGTATTGYIWTDTCTVSIVSTSAFYSWNAGYSTDCTISTASAVFSSSSTNRCPWVLIRGSASTGGGIVAGTTYCITGCSMISPGTQSVASTRGHGSSQNAVFAYNKVVGTTVGQVLADGFKEASVALTLLSNSAQGATSATIACASGTTSRLVNGDRFTFVGDTTNYTVTSTVTLTTGGVSVSFTPGLASAQDGSVTPVSVKAAYDGVAFVANAIRGNIGSSPYVQIGADSSSANLDHVCIWGNTFASTAASEIRWSMGYNEFNQDRQTRRNWSFVGNNLINCNVKADTFATQDGARTGAWTVKYMLGARGNYVAGHAASTFAFDFNGLYSANGGTIGTSSATPLAAMALTDPTNGDLTPASGAPARNLLPADQRPLTYDLAGNPYSEDGTTVTAGAYQYAADFAELPAATPAVAGIVTSAFGFGFGF